MALKWCVIFDKYVIDKFKCTTFNRLGKEYIL